MLKVELKNVIYSVVVCVGKEGVVRWRWGRKLINGFVVAVVLFFLYLFLGLFMFFVNMVMGNIFVVG